MTSAPRAQPTATSSAVTMSRRYARRQEVSGRSRRQIRLAAAHAMSGYVRMARARYLLCLRAGASARAFDVRTHHGRAPGGGPAA